MPHQVIFSLQRQAEGRGTAKSKNAPERVARFTGNLDSYPKAQPVGWPLATNKSGLSTTLVHMLAMSRFHNRHHQTVIHYFIDNAVNTLADAEALLPGELFTAGRPGIILQCIYTFEKTGDILFRYRP